MSRVKRLAGWGDPERRGSPVGDPPIACWDYPGFAVYFEHAPVLLSVLRHRPRSQTASP